MVRSRSGGQGRRVAMQKCISCGEKKPVTEFGSRGGVSSGMSGEPQSYCKVCKVGLGKKAMQNNLPMRIRHHMLTRMYDQLGALAPKDLASQLEHYLGYRIPTLVRHLKQDLQERSRSAGGGGDEAEATRVSLRRALVKEGAHIDHIKPLRLFKVVREGKGKGLEIDWEQFRKCWAVDNLRVLSKEENLAKGGRYDS